MLLIMACNKYAVFPYEPIELIHKIFRPSVGADVSRPPPIYRPSVAFHDIPFILLNYNIGPLRSSRYSSYFFQLHNHYPADSHCQREQARTIILPPRVIRWNLVNSCPGAGNGSNQFCISNCSPKRGLSPYSMS
jgi:hypothetical protein